ARSRGLWRARRPHFGLWLLPSPRDAAVPFEPAVGVRVFEHRRRFSFLTPLRGGRLPFELSCALPGHGVQLLLELVLHERLSVPRFASGFPIAWRAAPVPFEISFEPPVRAGQLPFEFACRERPFVPRFAFACPIPLPGAPVPS